MGLFSFLKTNPEAAKKIRSFKDFPKIAEEEHLRENLRQKASALEAERFEIENRYADTEPMNLLDAHSRPFSPATSAVDQAAVALLETGELPDTSIDQKRLERIDQEQAVVARAIAVREKNIDALRREAAIEIRRDLIPHVTAAVQKVVNRLKDAFAAQQELKAIHFEVEQAGVDMAQIGLHNPASIFSEQSGEVAMADRAKFNPLEVSVLNMWIRRAQAQGLDIK